MADLPKVSRRLSLIEAPKPGLSQGDIRAPYSMLADALGKAGEAANEVAIPLAEQAGYDSVRKDEAGNVVVDRTPLPILGDAGKAYNRTAQMTYVAQVEPEVQKNLTKMRLDNVGDPNAFELAAKAYQEELLKGVPTPATREAVRRIVEREAGQHYRTALVQADTLNVQNADVAYKSRIRDLDNAGAALARQGGTETEEYQRIQADLRQLYGELSSDPRFKYPAERVEREISRMADLHRVEAIIGNGMRIYDKGSPTAKEDAKRYISDTVWDPALNLSAAERQQAITRFMGALEGRTSENKAAVDANKKLVGEFVETLKSKAPYNQSAVNDLKTKSIELGDVQSYYKIQSYEWLHPVRAATAGLPLPEATRTLRALRASVGSTPLEVPLINRESGGDWTKVNDLGYAGGYQFGAPRLAALGVYTPGQGEDLKGWSKVAREAPGKWTGTFNIPGHPAVKTLEDFRKNPAAQKVAFDLHRAKMDQEIDALDLRRFEGQTIGGVLITRAGLHGMIHLGGAEGARAALESGGRNVAADKNGTTVLDYARLGAEATAKSAGRRVDGATQTLEGAKQELVNDYTKAVGENVEASVTAAEKALGKGRTLSGDELKEIAEAIHETGRADLIQRMEVALQAYDTGKGLDKQPAGVRWGFRSALQAAAARGASMIERKVVDRVIDTQESVEKGMKDAPYSTAASVRGLHDAPGPFNFADAGLFQAEIDRRNQFQSVQMNHDGTGPASIFEGEENKAFRGALAQANPDQLAGIFNGLERLDSGRLFATLDNTEVKDGLRGLLRSTDPIKLRAGMTALDRIYQRDPAETRRLLGDTATDRLRIWQTNLSWMSDKEVLDEIKRVNDPQTAAVITRNEKEGRELARKLSTAEVVSAFDESWRITPGFVARNITGSQPLAPVDPLTRDTLMGDFETNFARFYSMSQDQDAATKETVEKLKTKYRRSEVNGGRLMMNAPELHYPAVRGSHSWMTEQVEKDIAAQIGSRTLPVTQAVMLAAPGGSVQKAWDYAIVADKQTQADIGGGKPPSYTILVRDNRLQTPGWKPLEKRYAWDVAPFREKDREIFTQARGRVWDSWGNRDPYGTRDVLRDHPLYQSGLGGRRADNRGMIP